MGQLQFLVKKLSEKWSEFHETWKLSLLDHCPGLGFTKNKFPRAQRAEISVKGAKMEKNTRRAHSFALISMKLGKHDL